MAGRRTRPAASAPPSLPPVRPPTSSSPPTSLGTSREMRAPGHDDRRDQERLRAHGPRRGPLTRRSRGRSPRRRRSSAPTSCPTTPTSPRTSTSSPARCSRRAPRTPAGSTCSARTERSAPTRRAPCSAPGWPRVSKPRVHANQLGPGPGVQVAAEIGAAAADHCTHLDDADVAALADSGVVAGLLPGVEFSTRSPYPDARRLIDAGVTVALATDCNPGSSYTSSMPFCIALAVREMGMTPLEALWSATRGGALVAAPRRRGPPRRRREGRPRGAGCALARPPGLPAGRAAGVTAPDVTKGSDPLPLLPIYSAPGGLPQGPGGASQSTT